MEQIQKTTALPQADTDKLYKGIVSAWKTDKGFGFIKPDEKGQEVFLHISDLKFKIPVPQAGDVVCYRLMTGSNGKPRAFNAFLQPKENLKGTTFHNAGKSTIPFLLSTLILALLPVIGSIHFALITSNPIPLILYSAMSLLTFALYAADKSRAEQNRWRIPERTLHFCELLGGWLGAFVAQQKFRHKNRKMSYQILFWIIVTVHLLFWLDWFFLDRTLGNLLLNFTFKGKSRN